MGFRLRRSETLEHATQRIAREQLRAASAHLAACDGPERAEHVHDARRALTRLRGLARLIRPGIGDAAYKALNRELRRAVRMLAGARDADAAVETLEWLGADGGFEVQSVIEVLRRRARGLKDTVELPELGRIGALFEAGEFGGSDHRVLRRALRGEIVQLRERAAEARRDPSPEAMHDWRKSARHLRSLLRLLKGANRRRVGGLERGVDELCGVLGDLHDLQVVREQLREAAVGDAQILEAIAARERTLEDRAFALWRGLRPRARPRLARRVARWREAKRKR